MSFYAATLVELLIVETFVFFIWLKVLMAAVRQRDNSAIGRKLMITSIGLVITSVSVFGVVAARVSEYYMKTNPILAVTGFYMAMAIGGFLFIISAAIENSYKLVIAFFVATAIWTLIYTYLTWS
jgi:hypothetical protein